MDFNQMIDAWRAQDEAPLYGVNRDLLQLVLQNEQASLRRELRREQWVTWTVGVGMAAWTAFWLWILIYMRGPVLQIGVAALGTGVLALWVGGSSLSRRRQARRERSFGNTLQEEVRRNLSLVEYQLSRFGAWRAAMLWSAPVMVGSGLLFWLMIEVNLDPGESRWEHAWMILVLVWAGVFLPRTSSRAVTKKLEPRRQRLRELLATLDAGA
jgi:hypothetical protein